MAVRLCYVCGAKVPAAKFAAHRQRHRNASKTREERRMGTEYQRARRQVMRRDHETCQRCGRNKRTLDALGIQLHAHHRNENASDNRVENLVLLCEECHPRGGARRYDGL